MEKEFMSSLMEDRHTSKSPHSDEDCQGRLAGMVVPRADLNAIDRDSMFAILCTYFSGMCRVQFDTDLDEKDKVIVLRDRDDGQIQGFSTLLRMEVSIDGRNIVAFFSGDTIVARQYWGESILSRLWGQTVFAEADKLAVLRPSTPVYWFLICSGYKTFRFLPVFFREFYPNPKQETPEAMKEVIDTLAKVRYGACYDAVSGVVRFENATPLRLGVADISEPRLRDPMVSFFAEKNPGHVRGDELACITEISRLNLTRAGERMIASSSALK
jgi:hypothetical protein